MMNFNGNDSGTDPAKVKNIAKKILMIEQYNAIKKESKAAIIEKIHNLIIQEVDKK